MKSKKSVDIASALNAPHFQEQTTEGILPPDPSVPTRIRVNLDNLVPCSHNPRKTRNPKFDDIKESIRNRGLDEPPQVTRKDPSHPYMIKRGGNTRLEILNELWNETQDSKFYEFYCMFVPWPKEGELELLVGSIVENEARGDMLFVERALAAVDTKRLLEARDGKELGSSALSRELRIMGWSIDQSNLGQLIYAHDTLFPFIPNTFWNGMGRPGVKAIRKMLDNAQTFWESVAKPDEGNFDDIWQATFAALDGDAFEIGEAQNQLEADIALRLAVPFMSVRGEIQAISQGISPGGVRPSNLISEAQTSPAPRKAILKNFHTQHDVKNKVPTDSVQLAQHSAVQSSMATEHNQQLNKPAATSPHHKYARLETLTTSALMNHCFELAHEIALAFGFESLIDSASNVGFAGINGFHSGYVLFPENTDAPLDDAATFYYLYLHQLSCWFVDDHNNPEFSLVSNQVPLSFLGDELYWQVAQTMLHKRATLYVAWQQGDALGKHMPILEELEASVALISFRSGLGAKS
jgi:ParB family protein of integrating conjugative element (PFGI_1 class)